jgi:integrase
MKIRLTPQFIASAKAEAGKDRTLFWDTDLPSFGLVVTKAGHKSFVVQYRATAAYRGHDTRALQAYLGHKNIQHTVRYTESSPTRFRDFWR